MQLGQKIVSNHSLCGFHRLPVFGAVVEKAEED